MNLKTVVTYSSVWKFDMTLKRYIRFPRNETLDHPNIPYKNEWLEFDSIDRIKDRMGERIQINRGTRCRLTGDIESDDLGDLNAYA